MDDFVQSRAEREPLCEVKFHRFGIDAWKDQPCGCSASRTGRPEDIAPFVARIARGARAYPALFPDAGQRPLLTNPCLVREPYLQRLSLRPVWQDFRNQSGKVFFKSNLGLPVGLEVFRAHRHPPKAQSSQIGAYRVLMKFDAENHLDPTCEIHPPPTRDTISLWVRTVLDPSRQLRHLIGCEPQLHPAAMSIAQPLGTLGIITMNPIAQPKFSSWRGFECE